MLTNVRMKICELVDECNQMEQANAVSQRILSKYARNIMRHIEDTESTSRFLTKDKYWI